MEKLLKKLKNERGATGTDVLISATIIVLSIVVVSMLYVNTSLESRNITRTAGATRIATNIMESIRILSYDEFLNSFQSYAGSNATSVEFVGNGSSFFDTKIPTGFTVNISAIPVYGGTTNASKQFDLVRNVEIIVKYDVGKVEEKVNFNTVKQRELIEACNEPDLNNLRASKILKSGMSYYPIKYVQNAKAYVKTNESDPEWYNYQNRYWAMIVISKLSEDKLFDSNGKFIGVINTNTSNAAYTQKALWIPKFVKYSANKKVEFIFNASDTQIIKNSNLLAKDGSLFNYYTFASMDTTLFDTASTLSLFQTVEGNKTTGKWILLDADITKRSTDATAQILDASQYGPYIVH